MKGVNRQIGTDALDTVPVPEVDPDMSLLRTHLQEPIYLSPLFQAREQVIEPPYLGFDPGRKHLVQGILVVVKPVLNSQVLLRKTLAVFYLRLYVLRMA